MFYFTISMKPIVLLISVILTTAAASSGLKNPADRSLQAQMQISRRSLKQGAGAGAGAGADDTSNLADQLDSVGANIPAGVQADQLAAAPDAGGPSTDQAAASLAAADSRNQGNNDSQPPPVQVLRQPDNDAGLTAQEYADLQARGVLGPNGQPNAPQSLPPGIDPGDVETGDTPSNPPPPQTPERGVDDGSVDDGTVKAPSNGPASG